MRLMRLAVARRAVLLLGAVATLASCSGGSGPPGGVPATTLSAVELDKPLPSPLPDLAARVNGQPVPTRNVALAARQLGSGQAEEAKRPALVREAMFKLIVRELLFQEATSRGLGPDPRAMDQAYNEARIPYKDDAAWVSFLKDQGMDEQIFRSELRIQFTVKSLVEQESGRAGPAIPDDEARKFYEANPTMFESGERLKVRHIQVRVPKDMPRERKDELRTRVQSLLVRARKGEDFAKLAKEHSEDTGSKGKGGALAPFGHGQINKAFEDAAFKLKPGEISGVVETPFGFHIIKLEERLPSRKLLFEQVLPKVKEYLLEQRRAKGMEQLIASLRAKARIETFL